MLPFFKIANEDSGKGNSKKMSVPCLIHLDHLETNHSFSLKLQDGPKRLNMGERKQNVYSSLKNKHLVSSYPCSESQLLVKWSLHYEFSKIGYALL